MSPRRFNRLVMFHSTFQPNHRPSQFFIRHCWQLLLLAVLTAWSASPASAATQKMWSGGSATSGNWTTAANWVGGVAPVAGDILGFDDEGAARKTSNTNNFPAGTVFSTINMFGSGYRLRGNSVSISNYVSAAGNPGGTNIIDLDLIAVGPGVGITLESFTPTARLTLNGDISLGNRTLEVRGPGDFIINGVISGTAGIRKMDGGELSLSGFGANTYTGTTYVYGGITRLGRYNIVGGLNLVGTTAIPGDLVIGDSTSVLVGDIVALERDNQIADSSTVYVNSSGSLELSGNSDTVGELQLRGGTVTSGDGVLSVAGTVFAALPVSGSKDSVIGGNFNLGGRGSGPQIVDVAQGAQLNITAQISGVSTASLIKTNRGELWLTASNTFAGDLDILGGNIVITHGHALGTTNGVTRLTFGRLDLSGSFGVPERLETPGPLAAIAVASGNISWLGNVHLEDDLSILVPLDQSLTILGQISGPSGWTKFGDGTLTFKTAYTNSYAGTSWVREGNFVMDGVVNQPVIPGPFVIGNASDPTNSTRAWHIKHNQIADDSSVTVNRSGVLQLTGFSDAIGSLTFNGGEVDTLGGTLTLNGDIVANATNEIARLLGKVSLGGATRTIYTVGTSNTPDLAIGAVISDGGAPAGFNKVGEGSLRVNAANTFSGAVSVTDGQLLVGHSQALGSPAAGTTVSGIDGARIVVAGSVANLIIAEPLTLNSTGPGSPVVLENRFGNNQWNGPITLLAPESVIEVPSVPRPLALGGTISGPGGLRKTGPGNLTLNGPAANAYTGPTFVADGELILDKPTAESVPGDLTIGDGIGGANADRVRVRGGGDEIANSSRVVLNSSGQLILDSVLDLAGSIEGNGNIVLLNGTSGLVVGRNNLSTTFNGVISGAGSFEKVGQGTLTLGSTHSYTGQSGVAEGTLIVNGSIVTSAGIQVNRPLNPANNPAGVLGGTGFVPTIVPFPGGAIAPGSSPGRLSVQGIADLTGVDLRIEINGTTPGSGYDQLRVSGGVVLNNTRLQLAAGFVPTTNDTFLIVEKISPGPVSGTFLNAPQGSIVNAGAVSFAIAYDGGDGNDIVLRRIETGASTMTGIAAVTSDRMRIAGQGMPFATYVLETAPHLNAPVPWVPIATNSASASGAYEFFDAFSNAGQALYPGRFYRVLTQ